MLGDFPALNVPMRNSPYPGNLCLWGREDTAKSPLGFRVRLPSKEIKTQRMQISHLTSPFTGARPSCLYKKKSHVLGFVPGLHVAKTSTAGATKLPQTLFTWRGYKTQKTKWRITSGVKATDTSRSKRHPIKRENRNETLIESE